jgi:DNA-directed RNA polymerase specialized sigma24 family protein
MNWETVELAVDVPSEELADLDEALIRLQQVDAMAAELMKLRFFAGLSHREAAEILGIHSRTADRAAAFARAWLYRELRGREK